MPALQALAAYNAGMQYTLRKIPLAVDRALRELARQQGKTLNQVAIDALALACGVTEATLRHRDLTGIAGSWVADPDLDAALEEQDRIDEDLWK